MPPSVVHLTADFIGASPLHLHDQSLLSGVLVSAAGAAGLTASGPPMVIRHPEGGVSVILPMDGCHMSIHTFPTKEVALFDVQAAPPHDAQRALDVVKRRIPSRSIRTERRERG